MLSRDSFSAPAYLVARHAEAVLVRREVSEHMGQISRIHVNAHEHDLTFVKEGSCNK